MVWPSWRPPTGKSIERHSEALSSSSVDLSKHLGHQVTVNGSPAQGKMNVMEKDAMGKDAPAFTVTSLKMVAASCL